MMTASDTPVVREPEWRFEITGHFALAFVIASFTAMAVAAVDLVLMKGMAGIPP